MKIAPSPLAAALAGIVAALVWPWLWSKYGGTAQGGSLELIVGTLLAIVLPAHALVVGFGRERPTDGKALDTALLKRTGAWLVAAAVVIAIRAIVSGP